MHRMGARIKKRREELQISAGDLAGKIGVTPSLISQIERAKAFPSILTLKKLADELGTTVGELIGEKSLLIEHPHVKANEQKFAKKNSVGTKSYLLSHHDSLKKMDPFMLEFPETGDSREIMTSNTPGQEFCHVLEGSISVELGEHKYQLEKGDSFYFISNQNHVFTNTGQGVARMIWVVHQES